MESKTFERPESFSDLLERGRREIPEAPDFTARVRQAILEEQAQEKAPAAPETVPRWDQLLVRWFTLAGTKAAFLGTLVALSMASIVELSTPEPITAPPLPTFLIDQLFPE